MSLPEGFRLVRGWANYRAFSDVLDAIAHGPGWTQTAIRLYGRELAVPRLTAWMGTGAYTYSGIRHEPTKMPSTIATIHHQVEAVAGQRFNSVLGNLYRGGADSVAWHADDEPELGEDPMIASLSFGAPRVFKVRHNLSRQVWDINLEHGDLLIMAAGVQRAYVHAVPKTKRPVGTRINLTFRYVHP